MQIVCKIKQKNFTLLRKFQLDIRMRLKEKEFSIGVLFKFPGKSGYEIN